MKQQKVTPEDLENMVEAEQYHRFNGTTVTVCCLELENGHTVVGQSACVRPEEFDEVKGREAARADAIKNLWPLEGYRLRLRINAGEA